LWTVTARLLNLAEAGAAQLEDEPLQALRAETAQPLGGEPARVGQGLPRDLPPEAAASLDTFLQDRILIDVGLPARTLMRRPAVLLRR
jgi:hypothetical protein